MALKWLSTIVSCVVLVNALPISRETTQITETQTDAPKLLSLPKSSDYVSLMPEEALRSETSSISMPSPSTGSETQVNFSGSTVKHDVTSTTTDHHFSRGIRSVTESQEKTTVVPVTEQMSAGLVTGENGFTTAEVTTVGTTTETTFAPVDLDPYTLNLASQRVERVLSSVTYEMHNIEMPLDFSLIYDENSRPMLPQDIMENARQCRNIQPMLRAVHEVVQDFISFSEGVTTYTGNLTIKRALRSHDRPVLYLISPTYEYTPTPAPGTNEKNKEEVATTLLALSEQFHILREFFPALKNC